MYLYVFAHKRRLHRVCLLFKLTNLYIIGTPTALGNYINERLLYSIILLYYG